MSTSKQNLACSYLRPAMERTDKYKLMSLRCSALLGDGAEPYLAPPGYATKQKLVVG